MSNGTEVSTPTESSSLQRGSRKGVHRYASLVGCLLLTASVVGFLLFTDKGALVLSWARGESLFCEAAVRELSLPSEIKTLEVKFSVVNLSASTVTIFGAPASCVCLRCVNLPLEIPPRSRRDIIFAITANKVSAPVGTEYYSTLMTDATGSKITVTIRMS